MTHNDLVLEPNGVVLVLDIVFVNYGNYHRVACIFIINMKQFNVPKSIPQHILKAAAMASGRDTQCEHCPMRMCSDTMMDVCQSAYMRGFAKGVKYEKRRAKQLWSKSPIT